MRIGTRHATVAVLALGLPLAACGGGKGASSAARSSTPPARTETTTTASGTCRPAASAGRLPGVTRTVSEHTPVRLRFGSSLVELTVIAARTLPTITGHFSHKQAFRAEPGATFLGVSYSVRVLSGKAIEPERTVNRAAVVDAAGKVWLGDQGTQCGPVAASLAKVDGLPTAGASVAKGKRLRTDQVFVVPQAATSGALTMRFTVGAEAVRLRPH